MSAVYYDDHRWLSIYRPTENLRSISLEFELLPEPLRSTNNILFSGQAPSLRSVNIHRMNFQLPTQWFSAESQLSTLCISGQSAPCQLQVVESLSALPFLEILEIYGFHFRNLPDKGPKVNLPRLKHLITSGDLRACLILLDRIIPPPGCGLTLSNDESEPITDEDLSTASRLLSRYCESYFTTYIPQFIQLTLAPYLFSFGDSFEADIPSFKAAICQRDDFSSMSLLFQTFLSSPFSEITSISFIAEGINPAVLLPDPNFSKFISLFSSVNEVMTTSESLCYLSQIPMEGDNIPLPALNTVHLFVIREEPVQDITDFG